MDATPRRLTVGQAAVTVFNAGDISFDLAENLAVEEALWRPRYEAVMTAPVIIPMQCIHIQTSQASVLVDAAAYVMERDSSFRIAGYTPPADLCDQMAAAGIAAQAIEHVLITHAHWDHYNGLTLPLSGEGAKPAFANAQVYLGRGDWRNPLMSEALATPGSLQARTFGVLSQLGRVTAVTGRRQIAPGIEMIPLPGETPGHMMVRVASDGQTLYCVGDLYHHWIEVEQPSWAAPWADLAGIRASRAAFAAIALAEDALIVATHIRGVGRLARTADGVRWVEA